ncbi:transposase [Deinococcus sp. YIM 134068]|uniref:transposase n=1 Tax=Deinococcus lichenicola TaxID=3118910 RepID=UPI003FA49DC6
MKHKRFSEEQIIKLLQDAKKGEKPTLELCREAGCSTASFYTWKAKYGYGHGRRSPAAPSARTRERAPPQVGRSAAPGAGGHERDPGKKALTALERREAAQVLVRR